MSVALFAIIFSHSIGRGANSGLNTPSLPPRPHQQGAEVMSRLLSFCQSWSFLSCLLQMCLCVCHPQLRGKLKSGTTEAGSLSPLHLHSAFSASSPHGHLPFCSFIQGYFCFACTRAKLCLDLDSGSLSLACSHSAVYTPLPGRALEAEYLRKCLCKCYSFYKW